ncbi:MAG: MerR family transcriptional regulator [Chloroflexi bacterium]|nr:MerR family transcriptional regulator [Chloroflexota bacterium]
MYQRPRPNVEDEAEDKEQRESQAPPTRPENTNLSSAKTAAKPAPGDQGVIEVQGVYIISVAARILDMHPQTLRKYEKLGLINPGRTIGMLRLYSIEDIKKVQLIRYLSDELGLNLAGVEFALAAFDNMTAIKQRMDSRLEGIPAAQQAVHEEMDLLFESLNLPHDH